MWDQKKNTHPIAYEEISFVLQHLIFLIFSLISAHKHLHSQSYND